MCRKSTAEHIDFLLTNEVNDENDTNLCNEKKLSFVHQPSLESMRIKTKNTDRFILFSVCLQSPIYNLIHD